MRNLNLAFGQNSWDPCTLFVYHVTLWETIITQCIKISQRPAPNIQVVCYTLISLILIGYYLRDFGYIAESHIKYIFSLL